MLEGNWTETENATTTAFPEPSDPNNQLNHISGWKVIFVALIAVLIVTILSAMLYAAMKKKRLDQLRHHLVPLYNFDPGECEDWEAELLEEADQNSQKKIQDYKSMSSPTATSQH